MAKVDMNRVDFWKPPTLSEILERHDPLRSVITAGRGQVEGGGVKTRDTKGRKRIHSTSDDEADTEFPSVEELLHSSHWERSRLESSSPVVVKASGRPVSPAQTSASRPKDGNQESLVVLKGGEPDRTEAGVAETSPGCVEKDAQLPCDVLLPQDSSYKLSELFDLPGMWGNVGAGLVGDELYSCLDNSEQECSTVTSTQCHPHSLDLSLAPPQDKISLHSVDEPLPSAPKVLAFKLPLKPSHEDGNVPSRMSNLDHQGAVQQVSGEQDESPSTAGLSSLRLRHSAERSPSHIDQVQGHNEDIQERSEMDHVRDRTEVYESNNNDNKQHEQRRQQQDEAKITSCDTHHSTINSYSHSMDGEDEGDDIRPAKRRKQRLDLTQNPMPPHEHIPSSSPGPAEGYKEWAFQGFVKEVTIGDSTTFCLEYTVPRDSHHHHLSAYSRVLGTGSNREVAAKTSISHQRASICKLEEGLTGNQELELARMVRENKTWAEIGQCFPSHTLPSLKENFFIKQKGGPRKRGRKPGVRGSFT